MCIASIPRIGMGMTIVLSCITCVVLSFVIGWSVIGGPENIPRKYEIAGSTYYLAPVYLVGLVGCICGLVWSPQAELRWCRSRRAPEESTYVSDSEQDELETPFVLPPRKKSLQAARKNFGSIYMGYIFAVMTGVLSALQFLTINLAKEYERNRNGCDKNFSAPPVCLEWKERFNPMGSWLVSFAVGSVLMTAVSYVILIGHSWAKEQYPPPLNWPVMKGMQSFA